MAVFKSVIAFFILIFAFELRAAESPGPTETVQEMVKRINERYDDFFRYHRETEERWERLNKATHERKELERAHSEKMEKARQEYVQARKARPDDEKLRLEHEAREKERKEHHEMLRRRYVEQRDTVEHYLKKGRQVPEMKEFDLEE